MYDKIGEILSARRRAQGLSQGELAEALSLRGLSVTNQAVSKWEKGATLPSARQLLALCQILEIEDVRGEFSGGTEGLFAGLDGRGRQLALDYVQLLRDSGRYAPVREAAPVRTLPLYSLAVRLTRTPSAAEDQPVAPLRLLIKAVDTGRADCVLRAFPPLLSALLREKKPLPEAAGWVLCRALNRHLF